MKCSRCPNEARPNGRYCRSCHASYMRDHRPPSWRVVRDLEQRIAALESSGVTVATEIPERKGPKAAASHHAEEARRHA